MLKEFRFRNLYSFEKEQSFTMLADTQRVSELPTHLASFDNGESILKVASIYGPNASGKSNLFHALIDLRSFILGNLIELMGKSSRINLTQPFTPFKFTHPINPISEISVFFILNDLEIA